MSPTPAQVQIVESAVQAIPDDHFVKFPGGWPDKISMALLDAVYSGQQRYLSDTPGKGVFNRLHAFKDEHEEVHDDLAALVNLDEAEIRKHMGDNVVRDGRRTRKSVALQSAASDFIKLGVQHHHQVTLENRAQLKQAYTGIKGLGWVTFEYFLMLLGQPGIKPDTMIKGFVNGALDAAGEPKVSERDAGQILQSVYESLRLSSSMTLTDFDHMIWLWQRGR